jgi:rRNA maturation endonuclease Nob1
MFLAAAAFVTLGIFAFLILIRPKDLPQAPPVSPTHHLEVRKASIYENLRDLQFEYRVGKLSDEDYQRTKTELQTQLAAVLGEIEAIEHEAIEQRAPKAKPAAKPVVLVGTVCPHCKATFPKPLKFCGECGKPMVVEPAKGAQV